MVYFQLTSIEDGITTYLQSTLSLFLCKGKYHCTGDLQFDWVGWSCFVTLNYQQIYLIGQIPTSQTGGQPYSDTSLIFTSYLSPYFWGGKYFLFISYFRAGRQVAYWDQYYKTEYTITQIMTRFWFIITGNNWVQTSTYLHLLYRYH